MEHRTLLAALALVALPALALRAASQEPPPPDASGEGPSLDAVAFLAGAWVHEDEAGRTEEHWIEPAGGTMLGVGRTIRGERTVFFEFLRLEQREDGELATA